VKSGISHARLRPTLAVVDPLLTLSQPAGVTASSGMDILCHALESYTARPYTAGARKQPAQRVPYCGSNPVSDMWSERALALLSSSFRLAVLHGDDLGARRDMALAATFAGLGFGNAGVHIPHANAYPIAGQAHGFHPDGYPEGAGLVPHGMAVALTAPESFRFTFEAAPDRHLRAARLLEPDVDTPSDASALLPDVVTRLMRDIGIPSGVAAVGFADADIDGLVEGTLKQQRLLATAPRDATPEDLAGIFRRSMSLW
jgi:alcohol dehydrogenase class IV